MQCRVHKLVADVAVLSGDQVLMVRYRDVRRYDGQRGWFLPDDYLEHLEHPDDAARRILSDQAGLTVEGLRLAHIESFDGDGRPWHLVFHYVARLPHAASIPRGPNVTEAAWFAVDALPPRSELAHEGWAADVLEQILRP